MDPVRKESFKGERTPLKGGFVSRGEERDELRFYIFLIKIDDSENNWFLPPQFFLNYVENNVLTIVR